MVGWVQDQQKTAVYTPHPVVSRSSSQTSKNNLFWKQRFSVFHPSSQVALISTFTFALPNVLLSATTCRYVHRSLGPLITLWKLQMTSCLSCPVREKNHNCPAPGSLLSSGLQKEQASLCLAFSITNCCRLELGFPTDVNPLTFMTNPVQFPADWKAHTETRVHLLLILQLPFMMNWCIWPKGFLYYGDVIVSNR